MVDPFIPDLGSALVDVQSASLPRARALPRVTVD
jgi:hypothetical protein